MRTRSGVASFLMLVSMVVVFAGPACAASLKVSTQQGVVQGKTISQGKVRAFLGLPYAAPPVGALRWKAPEPPASWKGIREATSFGHRCMQERSFDDMIFLDAGESEDCLTLNVYTPANIAPGKRLPVMFWIHGGGYAGGSSSEPRHGGDSLPTKNVVLVTINYRLGVLGFLATNDLVKEGHGHAGNYALMDMIAALKWVQTNVAHFGGDPRNVTIFGESAGSFAVSTLMASPEARGLFAKAIGESGAAFGGLLDSGPLEESAHKGQQWAESIGAKDLAELRAMPARKLLDAAARKGGLRTSPIVDGRVLIEPVEKTYADGRQAHVPLLAGWNRDENAFLGMGMTAAKWKQFAPKISNGNTEAFLKAYPAGSDEEAVRSAIAYGSNMFIAFGTWKWIEAQAKTGDAPVYRYHLELAAPPSKYHPGWYAFHSDDIEYVFGVLDTRPGATWRPEDRKLSEQMMSYWTNFARTGNPNGKGLPEWPRYDKDRKLLHLDKQITAGPDTDRAQYEYLLQHRH